MRFEMFLDCKNVRDSEEDAVYELSVFLFKDNIQCLRMYESINYGVGGSTRKSDRIELLSIHMGLGYFLDYMNESAYFLSDVSELCVYVKGKKLFNRVVKGSGSLEDVIILNSVILRVKDIVEAGCDVSFAYDKDYRKRRLRDSKKSISSFPRLDRECAIYSLFSFTRKIDSEQLDLDNRLSEITGYAVKSRRRYYVVENVGVPLSMGIFNAVMD